MEELMQKLYNTKGSKLPVNKWTNELNNSEMKKQKYTKIFKKCLSSLACREMKTKTTLRFTFSPVTMVSSS